MLFCFCTDEKDVEKIVYEVDQVLEGGELSLPVYPGVGNRPLKKKKLQMPSVCGGGGGGMVTSKIIEPCIICGSWRNKIRRCFL